VEGGLDTFVSDLITGLANEFQIDFLCNSSHPGLERIKRRIPSNVKLVTYSFLINSPYYRGVRVNRLSGGWVGRVLLKLARKTIAYPFVLFMIIYWVVYFRKRHAEELIVVNGSHPGGLVCRAAGIAWFISQRKKVIYSVHNLWESIPFYRIPFEFFFDVFTVFSAKKMITVSKANKKSLDSNPIFKALNMPVSVIYNGSRTPSVKQSLHQKKFVERPFFTVLAAYEHRKGHEDLIQAIKVLKDEGVFVEVRCFGHIHNEYYSDLKRLVERLGLEKQIHLNTFSDNIDEIFAETRALIIPSKSYESFGLVAVEAFLRNVPVIAYRTGGLVEVVSDDVGLLVEVGDIKGLASAIKQLFISEQIWNKFSSNACDYARARFSVDRMITEYAIALGEPK
jgi:glycosyltransferase involved in cell wall biosynthesis